MRFLCRVNAYIKYGWDKNLVNPHTDTTTTRPAVGPQSTASAQQAFPADGWRLLTEMYNNSAEVPSFNNGHIVSYFVTRSVLDGLPSADFKSINSSAENLFRCGHIQHIEVCQTTTTLYIRASCLPEMRKDRVYQLKLILNQSYDVFYASCGCPAGKGPSGSCKHIGALCYAFSDFCKSGSTQEFLTCTSKLQSWNKPRGRKVDVIPVEQLCARRSELSNKPHKSVVYDPRPERFQKVPPSSIEQLRTDLLNDRCTQSCALLTIFVPSVLSVQHDHTYALQDGGTQAMASKPKDLNHLSESIFENEHRDKIQVIMQSLTVTSEQRASIEASTRQQNDSKWYEARQYRITGSKCGKILNQKGKTTALLQSCLYPKPFAFVPKPILWGRNNEPIARKAYVEHMRSHGHPNLTVSACGFYIHTEKCWLGASPDAHVFDPDSSDTNGIAELKCPFSKADMCVEAACEDPLFYCSLEQGQGLRLDRCHQYYHQVQLQLYTSGASWCDFCIYTTKNVAVERIYSDLQWQQEKIPILNSYFFDHMLPEIVCPKAKPSYFL